MWWFKVVLALPQPQSDGQTLILGLKKAIDVAATL